MRSSHDPKRLLNRRLFELNSGLLSAFDRGRRQQDRGKANAADLLAAGYVLSPASPSGTKREPEDGDPRTLVGKKSKKEKLVKPDGEPGEPGIKAPVPVTTKLVRGGDMLHIGGGERGPAGCYYMLGGGEGIAAKLAKDTDVGDAVCPAWYVAMRAGVPDEGLNQVCGNKTHKAGDAHHPKPDSNFKFAMRATKISGFRCNADGTKYEPPKAGKGEAGKAKAGGGKVAKVAPWPTRGLAQVAPWPIRGLAPWVFTASTWSRPRGFGDLPIRGCSTMCMARAQHVHGTCTTCRDVHGHALRA